ncbi:phosphotransferase [Paenibacillus sp. MWE-103]|uniref:Phosphotransferase n=1 Tax=Paenibacillus artemisiicola TaxID=1172618 RepID=A0ABS3W8A2_9BACL|nr:phosphotransferase [Paenibacillus artemisiicola]MBO7744546.1 phosphotransferase [Paenibacillus artemisiicola]
MDQASETALPGQEVLERLGVRSAVPLGGRLNLHWLVAAQHERLVLRRWAPGTSREDIDYEARLLRRVAALGWPVAPIVEGPFEAQGAMWSLHPFLPGNPPAEDAGDSDRRARGRLLARFHADLATLDGIGQRGGWRRCEEILGDETLDRVLAEGERSRPEEVRMLRWHLARARERTAGLQLQDRPGIVVHGDFTPWNLRFQDGKLTGILDFELAHRDHRIGDFALTWRGRYDEVVYGYDEVSPLEPEEWELLTPMWWAGLVELACRHLAEGTWDDGWIIKKLLVRSPLMGRDAAAHP